jgi:hypothetical protein
MSLFKSENVVTPNIVGVQDGSNATTGSVGELVFSNIAVGSAVSLTTATAANVTSISLTPGDWDVDGNVNYAAASATTATGALWVSGINTTSATIPTDGTEVQTAATAITTTSFKEGITLARKRVSLTTTTTVYLVAEATFTAGTVTGYGHIHARRVR